MKTLEEILINNLQEGCDLNIITPIFSLNAFYHLYTHLKKCRSIKILLNEKELFNKNKSSEVSYDLNNSNSRLLTHEKETGVVKDKFLDPYKAKIINDFIEKHVEIKVARKLDRHNLISFSSNYGLVEYFDDISLKSLSSSGCYYSSDKYKYIYHQKIFEESWLSNDLSKNFNKEFSSSLKSVSDDKTPELLYYFSLMHIFSNRLKEFELKVFNSIKNYKESLIYKQLYDFQRNAVHAIIDKINKFNGCILADAVGLGKTYEALAVIKYFELQYKKVLVLTPKRLRANWSRFNSNNINNPFISEKFNYQILNHSDLSRIKGKSGDVELSQHAWHDYDLVVIDESHNFRNRNWNENDEEDELENIKKSRYQKLLNDVIIKGRNTAVLLLSATPVNNRMQDINNQICLITKDQDDFFEENFDIKSVQRVCAYAERKSNEWATLPINKRTNEEFKKMIGLDFRKLVDLITIARSKKQILNGYKNNNIVFPKRLEPISIKPESIDTQTKKGHIVSLNAKLKDNLKFAAYMITSYIKDECHYKYAELYKKNNKSANISLKARDNIKPLMTINLLKRFESSVHSFLLTAQRVLKTSNKMYHDLLKNSYFFDKNNAINEDDIEDENDLEYIFESNSINIKLEDIDKSRLINDLKNDVHELTEIVNEFKDITPDRDQKLKHVIELINSKIQNPINNNNFKVIIFTSFADTASYLYDYINKFFLSKNFYSVLITGTTNKTNHPLLLNSKNDIDDLLTYFSPKSKNLSKKTRLNQDVKIDILIATDCVSEGQDLQDCDFLINYDIHWNPVKIIQRFGRIDRIGSENKQIQSVNIWPVDELDQYINLEPRIASKLKKISHTGTNDFEFEQENLKNQLEKIDSKDIDLEDIRGETSFYNLSLSEFTTDLKRYLEEKNNQLVKLPTNIYAIAKATHEFKAGIIFLLKMNNSSDNNNQINPYYLIYLDKNNKIIFNYTDVTDILNIYKSIAASQNTIQHLQVEAFNKETDFGKKMLDYEEALKTALEAIQSNNNENNFNNLFESNKSFSKTNIYNYELISFLVIKD